MDLFNGEQAKTNRRQNKGIKLAVFKLLSDPMGFSELKGTWPEQLYIYKDLIFV